MAPWWMLRITFTQMYMPLWVIGGALILVFVAVLLVALSVMLVTGGR